MGKRRKRRERVGARWGQDRQDGVATAPENAVAGGGARQEGGRPDKTGETDPSRIDGREAGGRDRGGPEAGASARWREEPADGASTGWREGPPDDGRGWFELDGEGVRVVEPGGGLTLVSAGFADGEALPLAHTGDGANVSPPLDWSGVPEEAGSLVLVFEGPDPTGRPGATFAHWVLYNLQPWAGGLELAADQTGLPPGSRRGRNDFGRRHYIGPLLDSGRHAYRFRLFALDAPVDASAVGEPTWDELAAAMEGHVLAEAELSCFVERTATIQPGVH